MREILFRGKRVDNGEWIEGWYGKKSFGAWPLRDAITPCADAENGYLHYEEVIPETVGQYTGLLDKNGKRIFEGDICRNTKTGEIVSVKWHGTMAGYVWSKKKEDGSCLFDFGELFRAYDKYEVIGNIHDNPEMIGGNANEVP